MLLLPVYPAAASTLTEDSCRDETAAQEMNAPRVTRTKNNHSSGPPHNIISVSRPKCPNRVPPHSAPSRDHDCLAERQFPLVGAPNLNPESPFCTRFFSLWATTWTAVDETVPAVACTWPKAAELAQPSTPCSFFESRASSFHLHLFHL